MPLQSPVPLKPCHCQLFKPATNRSSLAAGAQQQGSYAKPCNAQESTTAASPYKQLVAADGSALSRRQSLLASAVILQQLGLWSSQSQAVAAQVPKQQQDWLKATAPPSRSCLAVADIQTDYDRYAPSYDDLDGGAASEVLGFPELRRQIISQASGSVLEVAVGTGLNLPLYNWSAVTSLTGIDLSQGMLTGAASRVTNSIPAAYIPTSAAATASAASADGDAPNSPSSSAQQQLNPIIGTAREKRGVPVQLVQADVTSLPFPDNIYDVVFDTFSLCVFDRPEAALSEMVRVLKPGGRLLLLEHSRSDNPLLGAYQGATRSLVAPLSKGCDWGQDVPGLVKQLPGVVISKQQRHLAGTLVSITAIKKT